MIRKINIEKLIVRYSIMIFSLTNISYGNEALTGGYRKPEIIRDASSNLAVATK